MLEYSHSVTLWRFAVLLLVSLSTAPGCESPQQLPAAPLNDRAVLEKLATAYKNMSGSLATNPARLRPQARLKFVNQVFTQAGYDYSLTLEALAAVPRDTIGQYHKDMRELLYLPHYGLKLDEVKDIYTQRELQAIRQIDEHFK